MDRKNNMTEIKTVILANFCKKRCEKSQRFKLLLLIKNSFRIYSIIVITTFWSKFHFKFAQIESLKSLVYQFLINLG